MAITDKVREVAGQAIMWALGAIKSDEYERAYADIYPRLAMLANYYEGHHPPQLKPGKDGKDFNIAVNNVQYVIDRAVFMLVGGGVKFAYPDDATTAWIDDVWAMNRQSILLSKIAQYGAEFGTEYVQIVPDGLERDGVTTYRIMALNPLHMVIGVNQADVERIEYYVKRWTGRENNLETAYREITHRSYADDGQFLDAWLIETQKANQATGGNWQTYSMSEWPYPFAPIISAQNLPRAGYPYGRSDIEEVIDLQNDYNATNSNINKILWYQGHQRLYVSGGKIDNILDWGPDRMVQLSGAETKIGAVESAGDLAAARLFAQDLKSAIMEISHTTSMDTIGEKIGQITNFGLRLLFFDEIAKRDMKQDLFGEFLNEINRTLLMLDGKTVQDCEVIYGDVLPVDQVSETAKLQFDAEHGLVSKETLMEIRDYNPEQEKQRLQDEQVSSSNAGAQILRAFIGRGQTTGGI